MMHLVAQTILYQMGGGRKLAMMINARTFVALDDECGGVEFRFAGPDRDETKNGANAVKIILTSSDTYRVEFSYVRGSKVKSISVHEDIYADVLMDVFERQTGLYLTFGRRS